jgi:small nuclear ribonucleoprotein (snRNP)-like protein|tara:strand:+ start:45 stop:323 length:279 start_codon:yes stop_codon:yes gene_type:complete
MSDPDRELQALKGQVVVIDVDAAYVYAGTLADFDPHHLVLENADVHDLRDAATTRELYVLETRLHGVRANRKNVLVRREQVVSISAVDDVIE